MEFLIYTCKFTHSAYFKAPVICICITNFRFNWQFVAHFPAKKRKKEK